MANKQTDPREDFLYNVSGMLGFGLGASLTALKFHEAAIDIVPVILGGLLGCASSISAATALNKMTHKN